MHSIIDAYQVGTPRQAVVPKLSYVNEVYEAKHNHNSAGDHPSFDKLS